MKSFEDIIDEIIANMDKQRENARIKAFVTDISMMLRGNGVIPCMSEVSAEIDDNDALKTVFCCRLEKLDFSEHDKAFKDKIASLEKKNKDLKSCFTQREQDSTDMIMKLKQEKSDKNEKIAELAYENESLKQRIAELESRETEVCEKEPISDDCRPSMEWYENRHQSDCIEINRLNTTIDVLIHKVEYIRQFAGLE